jgi:predicted  nucleic acid-binding Zn-ribbon protein
MEEAKLFRYYGCDNINCPDTEDYSEHAAEEMEMKCPVCGDPLFHMYSSSEDPGDGSVARAEGDVPTNERLADGQHISDSVGDLRPDISGRGTE